jgi:hypothetical protein
MAAGKKYFAPTVENGFARFEIGFARLKNGFGQKIFCPYG